MHLSLPENPGREVVKWRSNGQFPQKMRVRVQSTKPKATRACTRGVTSSR